VGQKGFALHEKQGKRRKANIGHRVVHIRAAPSIGKFRTDRAKPRQKRLKNLHTSKTAQQDAKEYSNPGSSGHLELLLEKSPAVFSN
jgi:hypothetical protein